MNKQEAMGWDTRLSTRLRVAEQPGLLRTVAIFLAHSGDSWFWLLGLAILWWRGSSFWQEWAFRMGLAVLLTAGVVMLIKFIVRRRRPSGKWGSIYRLTDPHSFPSGHAARAVMLAVLTLWIGPSWLAVILVIWAPLVGLARVAMGVHYLSDVVAGWLLGILIGIILLRLW